MQTTLISVLKKYGDRNTSIDESVEEAVIGGISSVIEAEDDLSMPYSEGSNDAFAGHKDKTARLPESDDEAEVDGPWSKPNSLEIYKKKEKQRKEEANIFKKHPALSRFAKGPAKAAHIELSDESGDESYKTPSSSHSDLLSGESNPAVIVEEEEVVVSPSSVSTPPDTPVSVGTSSELQLSEVISEVGKMMVDVIEQEQRVVPPLDMPRVSPRQESPPPPSDWRSSAEPFTIIPSEPEPPQQQSSPWAYNRGTSSPARSQTTPVDTPYRGYETLPPPTTLNQSCPLCGLVFALDHDLSYRNFHVNSCLDSMGS